MAQTKPEIRDKWKAENTVRVALDMKPEIRDRWRAEAESRGIPMATMVKMAVEDLFEKKLKKLSKRG